MSARGAGAALAKKAGIASDALCPDLAGTLGSAGSAHALILLASVLERATAGEKILVLGFGQGADALLFEATGAIADFRPVAGVGAALRSEEHTSELQSLMRISYAVFCLKK